MQRREKKRVKLQVEVDLKDKKYHFISSIPNTFFPFEPYPEQLEIVTAIQQAINQGENALIESPTGTGKTLCLLVGALSAVMSRPRQKIFYLTRTHTQIGQVVGELQRTVYSCHTNIIASREQLCINHNLSQLKGRLLEKGCAELCGQKLCGYRDFERAKMPGVMGVHQFRQTCKKDMVCPYYYTRQLTEKCELTIMPFNYLLDWSLFQTHRFELKDAVVIFDEAHNIDSLAEQGANLDLISELVFLAAAEIKALIKALKKRCLHPQFESRQGSDAQQIRRQLESLATTLKSSQQIRFCERSHFIQRFEAMTRSVEEGIDLGNYREFIAVGKNLLKGCHQRGIICENIQAFLGLLERMMETASSQEEWGKFGVGIVKEGQVSVLRFRCLDPSLTFGRILEARPRSVILSSGTLGCLEQWERNLRFQAKNKLKVASFIEQNQLYAHIRGRSEGGVTYNFSFQGKQAERQFQQLGKELKTLESIVSDGIVVAFSNYDLMEKALKHSHLLKKKVYYESKAAKVQDIFANYSLSANSGGAFLFIIMRGRFSEGVNFNDKLCRCLVVVGVPYLPRKDATVIEKMNFLEAVRSRDEADKWYTQQSFRVLNQTLGRVIRSRNDYGVILLFDIRYEKQEILQQFSGWFSNCLRKGEFSYSVLQAFFKSQSWKNEREQTKNKIIKKQEPSLCERLLQFSTPSKTDRKIRKLQLDSQSQEEVKKSYRQPLLLGFREDQLQGSERAQSYRKMTDDLAKFFIKSGETEASEQKQDYEQNDDEKEKGENTSQVENEIKMKEMGDKKLDLFRKFHQTGKRRVPTSLIDF